MSFIVAIDGPAGAGKSTVARKVAERLDLVLVDTGALYRSVALRAQREEVGFDDDQKLAAIVAQLDISFRFEGGINRVCLGQEDVTTSIRSPEMSRAASQVSARPAVRSGLLELQRRLALAEKRGAVLEGRDIGTVVFPNAQLKIFLTASAPSRARRRHAELVAAHQSALSEASSHEETASLKGDGGAEGAGDSAETNRETGATSLPPPPTYEEVLADIVARDHVDESRALAPLRAADDAHWLDTTALSPEEVVERVIALARQSKDFPG